MPSDRRSEKRVTVYRAEVPGDPPGEWRVEYESVREALHFACRDLRERRRRPLEIVEDGVRLFDEDGIAAACRRFREDGELI